MINCKRCDKKEYIPTHQFIKFNDKIYYLCSSCWYNFHKWFMEITKIMEE